MAWQQCQQPWLVLQSHASDRYADEREILLYQRLLVGCGRRWRNGEFFHIFSATFNHFICYCYVYRLIVWFRSQAKRSWRVSTTCSGRRRRRTWLTATSGSPSSTDLRAVASLASNVSLVVWLSSSLRWWQTLCSTNLTTPTTKLQTSRYKKTKPIIPFSCGLTLINNSWVFLQVYAFGPIKFTFQMIYVGIVTALIVFPASIGIVALFRSLFTSSSQLPVTFFRKQNVGFLGCLEIDLEKLRKRREIDGKTSHLQLTLRRDSKMLCPVNALEWRHHQPKRKWWQKMRRRLQRDWILRLFLYRKLQTWRKRRSLRRLLRKQQQQTMTSLQNLMLL